ncbi:hypothetical protein BTM_4066 [Burkholderia thailandensis 34]|nr:hypothetical protein BTM_4066 [Burkholderia thailandensis 34]
MDRRASHASASKDSVAVRPGKYDSPHYADRAEGGESASAAAKNRAKTMGGGARLAEGRARARRPARAARAIVSGAKSCGGDGCWAGGAIARLGAVSAFRYAGGSRSIAARMSESVSAPVIRTGNLEMSSRRGPKRACAGFDIVRCARDDSGFAPGRSRGLLAMPSTGAPGERRRAGVRRASIVGPRRYARCPHPTIRPSFANIPCRAIHSAYAR